MKETVYRDYGGWAPADSPLILVPNNEVQVERHRLVYQATHGGDGSRLPLYRRSFMSFTYGGKPIEDFDLILTIVNNRMSKDGYASFEDIVTSYTNLDGQFYWNTHYKTNSLNCVLATDGIDLLTLDDFLFWFRAGEAKELILAEHPGRAIMARMEKPPQLSLLPFEYDKPIVINSETYYTKTTLYKGEITIDFIMDEPHWYSIYNILGREDTGRRRYVDEWFDILKNTYIEVFASKDALKILLEDGIPLGSMIDNNMILGNGAFANVESNPNTVIWDPAEPLHYDSDTYEPIGIGARIYGYISDLTYAASSRVVMATDGETAPHPQWLSTENNVELFFDLHELDAAIYMDNLTEFSTEDIVKYMADTRSEFNTVEEFVAYAGLIPKEDEDDTYIIGDMAAWRAEIEQHLPSVSEYHPKLYEGMIAGPIIDISGKGLEKLLAVDGTEIAVPHYGYFFYAGTAPSPTIIAFDMPIDFDNLGYFKNIANIYTNPEEPYSTITFEALEKLELRLTTPNIFTSYNLALKLLYDGIETGQSMVQLRDDIRFKIKHPGVRAWVNALLSDTAASTSDITTSLIFTKMQAFFSYGGTVHFSINSKTGEALATLDYRVPNEDTIMSLRDVIYEDGVEEKIENMKNIIAAVDEEAAMNAYHDLIIWGWSDLCIDNEGILLTPDTDDSGTINKYTKALLACLNQISNAAESLTTIPGILKGMNPILLSKNISVTEDVGDMISSNYIIIKERNYPNEQGKVVRWDGTTIAGKRYSHRVYHNMPVPINNLQIYYRNMYL